jgi:hypothetical protein
MNPLDEALVLVKAIAGSHLFGTATEASDTDYKGVFIPSRMDILMCEVRDVVRWQEGDVETEMYALKRFFHAVGQGHTVAIETLFTPAAYTIQKRAGLWDGIQRNADKLVTRKSEAFVRYARDQAARYACRGDRMAALQAVFAIIESGIREHTLSTKLAAILPRIEALASEHIRIVPVGEMPGGRVIRHLEVCQRQIPETVTLMLARDTIGRVLMNYGKRTERASMMGGADWKALSHAVRCGHEAIEILTTGKLIFPLACAQRIRAIKLGAARVDEVLDEVEALVAQVNEAAEKTTLPEEQDHQWVRDFIIDCHKAMVTA